MEKHNLVTALESYLHPKILEGIADMLLEQKVLLKITAPRKSKLGDYRNPKFNGQHQITVNGDLNKHAFAITLLHELAHLYCYNQFKNRVKPHGKEWKFIFKNIAEPWMSHDIFPAAVLEALKEYFKNPAASSCADPKLYKVLNSYDALNHIYVEDIPVGAKFILENGRGFERGEKKRTRILCRCLESKKLYSVSGVAKIKRLI